MPVYNREKYIAEAIDSILKQTFQDFELIIVDDGSTDKTPQIIKEYKDKRIRVIQNNKNMGVAVTRNIGYAAAKGMYIAVTDSDDINHKNRLAKQVTILDDNPDVDVVGFFYQELYDNGKLGRIVRFNEHNEAIRSNWIFTQGIIGIPMFRKSKLKDRNILFHNEGYKAAVDYQWYTSLSEEIMIYCIPEVLYYYRRHESQLSTDSYSIQQSYSDKIRLKQLEKIGLFPSEQEMKIHQMLSYYNNGSLENSLFLQIIKWCGKIKEANNKTLTFEPELLDDVLIKRLLTLLNNESMYNNERYQMLKSSEFQSLLEYDSNNFDQKKIKEIADKIRGKVVYIFGTKRIGYLIKGILENERVFIKNFLDNNKLNHHKKLHDCEILSPSEIGKSHENIIIVSVLSDERFIIKEQLVKECGALEENVLTLDQLGYQSI